MFFLIGGIFVLRWFNMLLIFVWLNDRFIWSLCFVFCFVFFVVLIICFSFISICLIVFWFSVWVVLILCLLGIGCCFNSYVVKLVNSVWFRFENLGIGFLLFEYFFLMYLFYLYVSFVNGLCLFLFVFFSVVICFL